MLNPLREIVERLGRRSSERPSPFRSEAESILEAFRADRRAIEQDVKHGDLTPKVARQRVAALAEGLEKALKQRAGDYSTVSRAFLDRLIEASERRKLAAERTSLDGLQRETNRLLRSVLVEQQIQVRKAEFESRAYLRPVAGGQPAPTLETLLAFHSHATVAGDDSAAEWGRRQLEGFRPLVQNPEDQRRIDLATDRADRVNPRLVGAYVDAMQEQPPEEMERFVVESVASKDANACMAAFVMAREVPDGIRHRWVRQVLEGIEEFPDSALTTLRALEATARDEDREAALAQAEFAIAQAAAEAKLPGLEAPSEAERARRDAIAAKPAARPGEPIGLALDRRGAFEGEVIPESPEGPAAV
jgi:hypothetical protein